MYLFKNEIKFIKKKKKKKKKEDKSAIQFDSDDSNVGSILKCSRSSHPQHIIVGHLNINSIRNKVWPTETNLNAGHRYFLDTKTTLDDFFLVS